MTRTRPACALVAALSLAFTLSGCIGQPPSPIPTPDAASPRPTETTTPTTDPVDPLTTVTAMVARPEALELRSADGTVVRSLDYLGSATDAVAALAIVLGGAPEDEAYAAGNHHPSGIRHVWDDAIVIDERFYPEEQRAGLASQLVWPRFAVTFRTPANRGIDLTTTASARVGDGFDVLGDQIDPDLWTCTGWALEHIEVPRTDFPPLKVGVEVSHSSYDTATGEWIANADHVAAVVAPVSVAEGCV